MDADATRTGVERTGPAGPSTLGAAVGDGWRAAKANLRPAGLLWASGVLLVTLYYGVEGARPAFEVVAGWKERLGFAFSSGGAVLAAVALPWALSGLTGAGRRESWRGLVVLTLFWAYRGAEVDALYRLQAWAFGDDARAATVAAKTAVDQLGYAPVWAIPTMLLVYGWKDGRQLPRTREAWKAWGRRELLPAILANWAVWGPAVVIIYVLPLPLQIPVQTLVLSLWVLIFTFLIGGEGQARPRSS